KIVDIGSGAGFPGMVIALAFPTSQVTLVDSTQKKFLFLEEVKKTLQIGNVFFKIGRVEDMKAEKQSFDLVTSRGFSSLPTFLEVGAPLCKIDGQLIAMRGSKGKEELKESSNAMEILGLRYERKQATTLPSNGDIRLNYLLRKYKPTSSKYPREWAKIIKHPL
ncbi:MAG: 16S rRNA (guanine(527)-N(7))-methyltransferase RsmG, partial [Bacilli bacterium]|nr:16S rRNA (guanine(527)-N(7))-methyltransferase RsmG [Bacilli bacterium]